MKDLKGTVAFVTGGNSGIGLGIAKVLLQEGCKVAITYRRKDHLEQAMADFKAMGADDRVYPVNLDVTDRPGFARAADAVEAHFGQPVQILVNNAGVGVGGPIEDATYDDWDWVVGVNLGGVINGVVTFLPRMVKSGLPCHIVNVSSMAGVAALGSVGLYATAKFGVVGLTEALRTDMVGRDIGVSVYLPGPVRSNIGESGKGRPEHLSDTGYKQVDAVANQEAAAEAPVDLMASAMDPVDAGRYVVDGIKQDRLFIFSHSEFRDALKSRHKLIEDSIPDIPINQELFEAWKWIMSNPVYTEGA
ncbi:MAG: SDR family NAD(P)-dependent oxidoreductase [Caulobacteraceae bacterium]